MGGPLNAYMRHDSQVLMYRKSSLGQMLPLVSVEIHTQKVYLSIDKKTFELCRGSPTRFIKVDPVVSQILF